MKEPEVGTKKKKKKKKKKGEQMCLVMPIEACIIFIYSVYIKYAGGGGGGGGGEVLFNHPYYRLMIFHSDRLNAELYVNRFS